jgi:hypothetical protein
VLSDGPQRREIRDFDYEAERRQRRLFILLMVGFAILAILAGIIVAIWVIPEREHPNIPPMPTKEPEVVAEIEEVKALWDEEKTPRDRPSGPGLALTLDPADIDRGIRRMQNALDQCAKTHGAIDETFVTVDFSVLGSGRVEEAYSRSPHTNTPLGGCVAGVFRSQGKFKRTRTGLADIRRRVRLRRPDLLSHPERSQIQK